MNQVVRDFRGEKVRIICEEQDVLETVYNVLVAPFASDFECGWMTNSNAENHVKNYLSYVGSLMIRKPDEHNVVSDRKQRKIKGMEITTDEIDKPKIKATPAPGKRKTVKSTKTSRLDDWRRKYPNADFTVCRVDTDGCFICNGFGFAVSTEVTGYTGVAVDGGEVYYPMDQVIVIDGDGMRIYLDQNAEQIKDEYVKHL